MCSHDDSNVAEIIRKNPNTDEVSALIANVPAYDDADENDDLHPPVAEEPTPQYAHSAELHGDVADVLDDAGIDDAGDRAIMLVVADVVLSRLANTVATNVSSFSDDFLARQRPEKIDAVVAELIHLIADTEAVQPDFDARAIFRAFTDEAVEQAFPGKLQQAKKLAADRIVALSLLDGFRG